MKLPYWVRSRVVAAILLVVAGWLAHDAAHRLDIVGPERPIRVTAGGLVSPLLDVELPEGYGVRREPIQFKPVIQRLVRRATETGRAKRVSVYFRDLMDGPWFAVNGRERYNPASLMKVPVMIAWLRRAEHDPRVLQDAFTFDERAYDGRPQSILPRKTLVSGTRYTVDELLFYMMAYSDNRAMWLLYKDLTPAELSDVLANMDVRNDPSSGENSITAHGYSGFLRILFNASYLTRAMSEKALRLLAEEDFADGISAGVPRGTVVAGKFGEFVSGEHGEEKQLHEFAIVYHPKGPYILGIMTVGSDLGAQAAILREVSSAVYAEVDSLPAAPAER